MTSSCGEYQLFAFAFFSLSSFSPCYSLAPFPVPPYPRVTQKHLEGRKEGETQADERDLVGSPGRLFATNELKTMDDGVPQPVAQLLLRVR